MLEPLQQTAGRQARSNDLHGHASMRVILLRLVNDPHAPLGHESEDPVATNLCRDAIVRTDAGELGANRSRGLEKIRHSLVIVREQALDEASKVTVAIALLAHNDQ